MGYRFLLEEGDGHRVADETVVRLRGSAIRHSSVQFPLNRVSATELTRSRSNCTAIPLFRTFHRTSSVMANAGTMSWFFGPIVRWSNI